MSFNKNILAVSVAAVMAAGLAGCNDTETEYVEVPGTQEPLEVSFERTLSSPHDGAWYGLHDPMNELDYVNYNAGKPVPNGAKPWRNNQYVLGQATTDTKIWYGASTSVFCYWPMISMKMPTALMNFETERMACQLLAPTGQMPDAQPFMYDPATGENVHIDATTLNDHGGLTGEQFWSDMMDFRGEEIGLKKKNPDFDDTIPEDPINNPSWIADDTRYAFTFRAAGAIDGLVFMMGYVATPIAGQEDNGLKQGYNRLFVFNEEKMEYLGFAEFNYDTVRRFQTVTHPDGSEGMYWFGGPDQSGGQAGISKNQMLRWVGSKDKPLEGGSLGNGFDVVSGEDFLKYGVVGDFGNFVDKDGDTRFVSSAWYNPKGEAASMLFTNKMPAAGFTAEDPVEFKHFFQYDDYDPDTVAAHGSKLAANAFYGDYLYFGSYHQGTSGAYDHLIKEYCKVEGFDDQGNPIEVGSACAIKALAMDQSQEAIDKHEEFMMKSWRALSLFRIKTSDIVDGTWHNVELLYGNEEDWVYVDDGASKVPGLVDNPDYDPTHPSCETETPDNTYCSPKKMGMVDEYNYHFEMKPNRMGQKPKWGKEGFGHEGNVYTFTMVAHDDKLFVGTWNATAGLFDIFDPIDGWKNPKSHDCVALGTDEVCLPGEGQKRLTGNNPAYFLYNAVKEQNQDDIRAGRGGWMAVFEDTDSPATIVDKYGFGNECNNGIRNYAKVGGELYFGTTSWCNLTEDAGLEFYKYTGDNR